MLDRKTFAAARREVMAEIQSLMSYLEEYLVAHPGQPPADKVVVCDEAQRAWDAEYGAQKFSAQNRGQRYFLRSWNGAPIGPLIIALVGARWSLMGTFERQDFPRRGRSSSH